MMLFKNRDEKRFEADKAEYIRQSAGETRFLVSDNDLHPCLADYYQQAGAVDSHYFFQDIYVAQKVFASGVKHIHDIGSRLDGYIGHLLAMDIRVTMIDIRPLDFEIENLDFVQGNATDLGNLADNSVPALSCLHALEHFGLGRYGDPVDYHGWEKALAHYKRILKPSGSLYLSVPSGNTEKVVFHAHRIFRPRTVFEALSDTLTLTEFSNLHDRKRTTLSFSGEADRDIAARLDAFADEHMGEYDCGIYIFQKPGL